MDFLNQVSEMLIHMNFRSIYNQKPSVSIRRILSFFTMLVLIISFRFYFSFSGEFNKFQDAMRKIPYFTIINGQIKIEAEEPYYPISGDKGFIVDTTGNTSPSVLDSSEYGMLVTKDKCYLRANNDTKSFDLKVINDMSNLTNVTRNDITSWVMSLKWPLFIIFVIVISMYNLIAKTISILFLSLIIKFFASKIRKEMSYNTIFNISAYSFILPIFLYWLRDLLEAYIPLFFILYWSIAAIYGYMAVKKYIIEDMDIAQKEDKSI